MVATTRSRSSPPLACLFLSPKQEESFTEKPRTRAHARAVALAQGLPVKEKREGKETRLKRKCSSLPARKNSVKEEIREETDCPHDNEASELEHDDSDDADYKDDSDDEDETKRKTWSSQKEAFSVVAAPTHYESLRLQRIAENKARMAALGVQKHAESLTSFFKVSKPKRTLTKSPSTTPLELRRRSQRLMGSPIPAPGLYSPSSPQSYADEIDESPKLQLVPRKIARRNFQDEENIRPGNAPLPKNCPTDLRVSPVLSALRCRSKYRGTIYDGIVGICCHFCRQKTLCGEEDCERCGQRDVTKACLGKSDCSKCHSSTGVFCRACLKIRYGEDIEQVRERGDWLCPHCSEEQGGNPYWICNSSICLTRRNIPPTGIAIYTAREMGFESVAHYLADYLKKRAKT